MDAFFEKRCIIPVNVGKWGSKTRAAQARRRAVGCASRLSLTRRRHLSGWFALRIRKEGLLPPGVGFRTDKPPSPSVRRLFACRPPVSAGFAQKRSRIYPVIYLCPLYGRPVARVCGFADLRIRAKQWFQEGAEQHGRQYSASQRFHRFRGPQAGGRYQRGGRHPRARSPARGSCRPACACANASSRGEQLPDRARGSIRRRQRGAWRVPIQP